MDDQLPYRIRADCYTLGEESEIDPYYEAVVACVEGTLSPIDAAERITAILADQARQSKADIDSNQKNQPYVVNTDLVAVVIGSASSSFAPESLANERLRSFACVRPRQVLNPILDRNLELRPALKDLDHLIDTRPHMTLWENLDKLHLVENLGVLAEIGKKRKDISFAFRFWIRGLRSGAFVCFADICCLIQVKLTGQEWKNVEASNNSDGEIDPSSLPD